MNQENVPWFKESQTAATRCFPVIFEIIFRTLQDMMVAKWNTEQVTSVAMKNCRNEMYIR